MKGVKHIWISNESILDDLLAKNARITSDRPAGFPNTPGAKDYKSMPLTGTALLGFQDDWRRHRRFTDLVLAQAHQSDYWSNSSVEIARILNGLLKDPQAWSPQLEQFQARFLSRCAYGTPKHASALSANAYRLLLNTSPSGEVSSGVDEKTRENQEKVLYQKCEQEVRENVGTGSAPSCFARFYLENDKAFWFPEDEDGTFAVGTLASAGIHKTSSTLHTFFLAMTVFPEWMSRLQKEVDAVCGERMPALSDMPSLPLVRAIIKECIRWRPPIPLGIIPRLQRRCTY